MCACVPVQLEDKVNEDTLISFCICLRNTLQLCIPQFVHSPTVMET